MSQPASTSAAAALRLADDDTFDEVENFHGVYLLVSTNPRYKGRTYIGYTVDPNRRIVQHNRGRRFGGACRTNNRGPWDMVLVVHGFPNDVSGLRFEWAWQHPERSRRLRGRYPAKKGRVTKFQWLVSLLGLMLQTDPWCQLPLVVRWLLPKYKMAFPADANPPSHMVIIEGLVRPKRLPRLLEASAVLEAEKATCHCCSVDVTERAEKMSCFFCFSSFHCSCLASCFLTGSEQNIVPVEGKCPSCGESLLWGDLIRFKRSVLG